MYNYDYYYEQAPSEIDALIEETIDKIRDTILLKAKDEVESQTQKAKKISAQYDEAKRIWRETHDREQSHIKELTEELNALKEEYNKKRSEIPSLDFEIGEKVLVADIQFEVGKLVCPTCHGRGRINVTLDEYGDIETICPHCKNNTYEGKNNLVREIKYHQYRPTTTTVVRAVASFEEGNKIYKTYYTKEHNGSCEVSHSEIKSKIFKVEDIEACRKYCKELNEKELEKARKHIYKGK